MASSIFNLHHDTRYVRRQLQDNMQGDTEPLPRELEAVVDAAIAALIATETVLGVYLADRAKQETLKEQL